MSIQWHHWPGWKGRRGTDCRVHVLRDFATKLQGSKGFSLLKERSALVQAPGRLSQFLRVSRLIEWLGLLVGRLGPWDIDLTSRGAGDKKVSHVGSQPSLVAESYESPGCRGSRRVAGGQSCVLSHTMAGKAEHAPGFHVERAAGGSLLGTLVGTVPCASSLR